PQGPLQHAAPQAFAAGPDLKRPRVDGAPDATQGEARQSGTIVWYNGRRRLGRLRADGHGRLLRIPGHGAPNGALAPPVPGGLMHGTRVTYLLSWAGPEQEPAAVDVRPIPGQVGLSCGGDSQAGRRPANEDRTVAVDLQERWEASQHDEHAQPRLAAFIKHLQRNTNTERGRQGRRASGSTPPSHGGSGGFLARGVLLAAPIEAEGRRSNGPPGHGPELRRGPELWASALEVVLEEPLCSDEESLYGTVRQHAILSDCMSRRGVLLIGPRYGVLQSPVMAALTLGGGGRVVVLWQRWGGGVGASRRCDSTPLAHVATPGGAKTLDVPLCSSRGRARGGRERYTMPRRSPRGTAREPDGAVPF
ncbi:unnamed protein product, partial [Prorocentrum cordatum]